MMVKTLDIGPRVIDFVIASVRNVGCYPPRMHGWNIVPTDDSADFYSPSTLWEQGGPIIEEAGIEIRKIRTEHAMAWRAVSFDNVTKAYGPTPLIAGMRCFVAQKLDYEIEIPDGLATA